MTEAEHLGIFAALVTEGFAGPWVMKPEGRGMAQLERGKLQTSWVPALAYWKTRDAKGTYPVPDVDLSQSMLLVHPDLMDGLPMTAGVDYEELEVVRRDFPHRVLSILNSPGVFDPIRSESSRAGDLIITVTHFVFDEERLAGRSAFLAPELVSDVFLTSPVVGYLRSRKARGLEFRQVWPAGAPSR